MTFIYHRCPENMQGNTIYPMSELLEIYPEIFAQRQKHHEFQPRVLEGSIPRLGCFWNDTLHFTALHPKKIEEALNKFGFKDIKLKYFEIESEKLSPEKTMVYLNKPKKPGEATKYTDFIEYNHNEIDNLAYIPEESMGELKIPTSDEFLLNYHAPIILYKGRLDVAGAKIIEV